MKRIFDLFLLFALIAVFSAPAFCADLDEVLKGVKDHYEKITDLKADFVQETFVKTLGKKQFKNGKVYFKRPDKMRWDYEKPDHQQLLTDGFTLWAYNPEEKVVYMNKLDKQQSAKVPMQVLGGQIDVKKEFDASLGEIKEGKIQLVIKPKGKGPTYEKAILFLDESAYEVRRIDIVDLYGNVTTLKLTNVTINNQLKDSEFVYTPKPGVEVLSAPVMD